MLWNYVSQEEALRESKNMYSEISTLLTGAAWDRTLGWLYETGAVSSIEIMVDSKTWGNYRDDNFTNNDPPSLINTGEIEKTEKNNIFDLAGNLSEWTTEILQDGTNCRVVRGGAYNFAGSNFSVSVRMDNGLANAGSPEVGFRPVLFL